MSPDLAEKWHRLCDDCETVEGEKRPCCSLRRSRRPESSVFCSLQFCAQIKNQVRQKLFVRREASRQGTSSTTRKEGGSGFWGRNTAQPHDRNAFLGVRMHINNG